ncbi:MAG: hypothetical protein ABIT01_03505, partial [Thermoanaerobaculia bacterium]
MSCRRPYTQTAPLAPAENVIAFVVPPELIVPPVIDQEYEAPAPSSGTEAAPAAPGATLAGALIAAFGEATTVTGYPADVAWQPAGPVTWTLYVVVDDGDTVIVRDVAPVD